MVPDTHRRIARLALPTFTYSISRWLSGTFRFSKGIATGQGISTLIHAYAGVLVFLMERAVGPQCEFRNQRSRDNFFSSHNGLQVNQAGFALHHLQDVVPILHG